MTGVRAHLRALLRRTGYDIRRYASHAFPELRRAELMRRHDVDVVVDGGAHYGGWSAELRTGGYGGAIVAFEPDAAAFAALESRFRSDAYWTGFRLALGAEDGQASFHVNASSATSSLHAARPDLLSVEGGLETVRVDEVEVRRLDSIDSDVLARGRALLLKLDVQGHELAALAGAETTLERCRLVELELSFASIYEDQPLYRDVTEYLEARGFAIATLEPVFYDDAAGTLLQVNGLFVRTA